MAYSDFRQERCYGFKRDIIADLQSYLRGGDLVTHLPQEPNVSPCGHIGFSHLDGCTNEGLSPVSPSANLSHLNMSSALESIMSSRIFDFKTPSLELFPAEEGSTVVTPSDLDEGEPEAAEEDVPTVVFQSKFFDSFPLYQDYFLPAMREKMGKLKDGCVSELMMPEHFNSVTGIRRSERCESEPSKPQSLQSPLSPLENLEFHSLPDRTPPSSGSCKASSSPPPLKKGCVSELLIPEYFNSMTGIRRSERCESEQSKPQSLQSSLNPLENLEFHTLLDRTPPSPQSRKASSGSPSQSHKASSSPPPLKDGCVSELIIPEHFNSLTGICRSERCELEPSKPQSLQSPRSPLENLEFHTLLDRTPPSPQSRKAFSLLPSQSRKASPYTLWQDLPEVKRSGVLSFLTPKEISLQETMFELIGSEASYLKSLGVLVDHFFTSKALKKTVSKMEHKVLFSNICRVMAVSARFLKSLEKRLDEKPCISQVGDIVLKHCRDFLQTYVPYVTNMSYQESLVSQLLQQNQDFASALKKLESDSVCHRQTFKSFLVLPFQRITRIKLFLESILKLTKPGTDSASNLEKAINTIHEIVMTCDNNVKTIKKLEELACLQMVMDFGDVKSVPLVLSTRHLVRQGSMKLLTENAHGSKMYFVKIYLHLFNDILIISSKKNQKFMVVDHAIFPAHVTIEHLATRVVGLPPESFLLHLSQSQRGLHIVMILVANTRSDKEEWMKALSSG